MTIEFIEKENDFKNEQTRYWFDVDGEGYAICDQNGVLSLIDEEGFPIEEQNDHEGIKDLLIPEYEKHLLD